MMVKKIDTKDLGILEEEMPAPHITDVVAQTKEPGPTKASKPISSNTSSSSPALSVRLVFNKDEYKALLSLALLETEKTGKRCSVTNLIYQQTSKLIKKGNKNA